MGIWPFVREAGLLSGFKVIKSSGPFGLGGRAVTQADAGNSDWLFQLTVAP